MSRANSRKIVYTVVSVLLNFCRANAEPPFKNWSATSELEVQTGDSETLLPPGHQGLNYFPDEPIAILGESPLRFLMVCGDATYLLSGVSWSTARPVAKVLSAGPAGSPDNGYAGIGATFFDRPNNRIVGFYHAEDHEGLGKLSINGVNGFYGTVCAAVLDLNSGNGHKLGPVIVADKPKLLRGWETEGGPHEAWSCQGVGEPHVCIGKDGKYLFCYYTEWSNRLKRGVEICLARSQVSNAGIPGTWEKCDSGKFGEKGIGGHETPVISAWPVADTFTPQATYIKPWHRYVLVFGVAAYSEMRAESPTLAESGFYVTTSTNGLDWTRPEKALTMLTVFFTGRTCGVHPTLILSEVTENTASGMLLYGISENWGQVPHHLAGCPIRLKLTRGQTSGSSNRVTVSGDRGSEKRLARRASARPSTQRSRAKSASELAFEQSVAGKYRFELTNTENGATDAAMTVELQADKTVRTSDGRTGIWDTKGKQLIVKISDIETGRATKHKDGTFVGTLTNKANGLRFRYKMTKIE